MLFAESSIRSKTELNDDNNFWPSRTSRAFNDFWKDFRLRGLTHTFEHASAAPFTPGLR
jgi:hypothetical protein